MKDSKCRSWPDRRAVWMTVVAAMCGVVSADPMNSDTDWMVGKMGAFMHYLPGVDQREVLKTFDVEGLKRQLVDMRADFFIFTLGQNANFYNAPNAAFARIAGADAVTQCAERDVPAEIIVALKGTGIRFGLYSPCQPSFHDEASERKFGFERRDFKRAADWRMTDEGATNWAKVLEEWAVRYGEAVEIWWFDGARPDMGFTDRQAKMYREALLKGNPHMVMTFNWGLLDWKIAAWKAYDEKCGEEPSLATKVPFREFKWKRQDPNPVGGKITDDPALWTGGLLEPIVLKQWMFAADFTSGEADQPFRFMPNGRWFKGNQHFILSYLGHYWMNKWCRYPDDVWLPFLREYVRKGGCICFDMAADLKTGLYEADQRRQFRRLKRALDVAFERKNHAE